MLSEWENVLQLSTPKTQIMIEVQVEKSLTHMVKLSESTVINMKFGSIVILSWFWPILQIEGLSWVGHTSHFILRPPSQTAAKHNK